MTTNHHTPLGTGAEAKAAVLEAPLAELDQAITTLLTQAIQEAQLSGAAQAGCIKLNFTGAGLAGSYNPSTKTLTVTVAGTAGTESAHVVQRDGVDEPVRSRLNFVPGNGLTLTDNSGNDSADISFSLAALRALIDLVYAPIANGVTNGDSHDHAGGDGAQIDHGGLAGLGDDDHAQYLLATGLREWAEQAGNPATPGADKWKAFFKSGGLYVIDDAGVVTGPLAAGGGGAFWTAVPGTPTRVSNTQFTVTGDYSAVLSKATVLKWTNSGTKQAMVIAATYSAPNTTIDIIGDVLAAGFTDMKYAWEKARQVRFAVAGTIGATGTDVAGAWFTPFDCKIFGLDEQLGTAGNGTTTVDINDDGTTMFTTKPSITTTGTTDLNNTADDGIIALEGSKITMDIDAAAATPGVDLYATVYYSPSKNINLT